MKNSKKFYKKVDITFWFVIMALPFVIFLIRFVGLSFSGSHLTTLNDVNSLNSSISSDSYSLFTSIGQQFSVFGMSFISDIFTSLATDLQIDIAFVYYFTYMASIVFYHLLLDIIVFVPKFFHSFLRRVDKYEE